MSDYLVTDTELTETADAIRAKTGDSAAIEWESGTGFADAVAAISGGGIDWEDYLNGLQPEGALSLPTVTKIHLGAFYGNQAITSVSAPEVTVIDPQAFTACSNLQSASFPKLTSARYLSSSWDNTTGLGAFEKCTKLASINMPELTSLTARFFQGCARLAGDLYFPKVTSIGESVFLEMYVRYAAIPYRTITLPKLIVTTSQNPYNCFRSTYLDAVDLGEDVKQIGRFWFYSTIAGETNSPYKHIILRSTTMVVANASNSISGLFGSSIKIYVPQDLIESYKTATNWSSKGNIFYAIEGSEYEYYYANGVGVFQSITKTLTNCTLSNDATDVSYGEAYAAQLTADDGYSLDSVAVTMGGTDITASAYDSTTGEISIATVTGAITITASAS